MSSELHPGNPAAFDQLRALAREIIDNAVPFTDWISRYAYFCRVWSDRLVDVVLTAKAWRGGNIHANTVEHLREAFQYLVIGTELTPRLWTDGEIDAHLIEALTRHDRLGG